MNLTLLVHWSLLRWFSDVSQEMVTYFEQMSPNQWMVLSACGVAFGFLLLKGTTIRGA